MYTYIFLQTDLQVYISLKNQSREFHKRSKHFLFSDHFIVYLLKRYGYRWEKIDVVTIGTGNFFCPGNEAGEL